MSWDGATDAETPQDGLYYNAFLYQEDGDVVWCSMADISNGYRRIPAIGNAQQDTSWTIEDLGDGTYHWSVQAIDTAFAGSAFATEHTFLMVQGPTVSITPQTPEVSSGGIAIVNITLNEAPDGLSGYNLTVSLSNVNVAEILSVSFPPWASLNDNSIFPADSVWIKGVDLGDHVGVGATDVNLGTLTLRGDSKGTSDIVITVTKMDADDGYPINPDTTSGTIEVTDVIPLLGYTDPPTDPDQDGLYEDLNGNSMIDFDDVVLYFEYLEWIEANEPNACFDFNGNGWIDFDDLVKLFEEV